MNWLTGAPRTRIGRRMVEQAARQVPADIDLWPAIQQRIQARGVAPTSPPGRRWAGEGLRLAVGAAAVAVIALALALVFRFDPPTLHQPGVGNATPVTTPTPAAPTQTPAAEPTTTAAIPTHTATAAPVMPTPVTQLAPPEKRAATTMIAVGNLPINLAAGAGAVWVPNIGDRTLSRIDPDTNEVVATIDIPTIGVAPSAIDRINQDDWGASPWVMTIAAAGDQVWVTQNAVIDGKQRFGVQRIDPETNAIAETIPLDVIPYELAIDLDHRTLWVLAASASTIVRIDLDTGEVFELADLALLNPFRATVVGDELWVLSGIGFRSAAFESARNVSIIDIETNAVLETIETVPSAVHLAHGAGAVWVAGYDAGELVRIDPASRAIVAIIPVATPAFVAADNGSIWVSSQGFAKVLQVDPETNQIVAEYGNLTYATIAVGEGAVWVSSGTAGLVARIDP